MNSSSSFFFLITWDILHGSYFSYGFYMVVLFLVKETFSSHLSYDRYRFCVFFFHIYFEVQTLLCVCQVPDFNGLLSDVGPRGQLLSQWTNLSTTWCNTSYPLSWTIKVMGILKQNLSVMQSSQIVLVHIWSLGLKKQRSSRWGQLWHNPCWA